MKEEKGEERILIFSAGANIHNTYHTTVRIYDPTKVYVMVEKTVLERGDEPKKKEIVDAIDQLRNFIIEREKICDFNLITIEKLDQFLIQEKIIDLRKQYPDAHFIFNITAGTALFSASMLLMGIMIGADICITRTSKNPPIKMEIPGISLQDIQKKKPLMEILKILNDVEPDEDMSNGVIMNKLGIKGVNSQGHADKTIKSGDKANQSKRMEQLIQYKLVEETRTVKREKYYKLTYNGRLMSKFII